MIRVAVVDDQHLVRAGLRALLERAPDIEVVGEAADGQAALSLVRRDVPDVVLMDVRMPGLDGIAATKAIMADERLGTVHVLVLTTFDTDEHVFDAIRAGADGFLLKTTEPEELRAAVRAVAKGEATLSAPVTRRLMDAARDQVRPRPCPELERLTEREREVLVLVAGGLSNDEIARELTISPATSRTYVSRLLTKLHARDRAQLVVIAYRAGIVPPE
ncbi:response regulator transcription factor [Actinomycetes bacterium KLBMP 9759]